MKGMKKHVKKALSLGVSLAMLINVAVPSTALASVEATVDAETVEEQAQAEDGLILYYDFDLQNSYSTIIGDSSGNNNFGELDVVSGTVQSSYEIVDTTIFGKSVKALSLPGGETGAFLRFPDNIFEGMTAATISVWVNLSTDNSYQRIWDFGSDTTSYMYLLSDGGNDGFKGYASAITTSGWSNEKGVSKGTNIGKNRWVLTTVVVDGSTMSLYENGELIGAKDTGLTLSDLGETTANYLGYGQFGDDPTAGQFAEVKIYNKALSSSEIAAMYQYTDADYAAADQDALTLDSDSYTSDFILETTGAYGSSISWKSNNSAITVNGEDAVVARPQTGQADATVTLTATITYGSTVLTKSFTVTVPAVLDEADIVAYDKDKLSLGDTSALVTRLSLPDTGEMGSTITWKTSDETVIKANGRITRPAVGEADGKATLTAMITYGSASDTKTFDITVLAKVAAKSVVSYEEISVTTNVGVSPSLPNFVKVTYSDGSTAKVRAVWPAYIEDDYSTAGSFTVEGTLQDSGDVIVASVTVGEYTTEVDKLIDSFDLSDITLDGDSALTQNRERTITYLKLLDNDRMLYNFRKTFGVSTQGATALGGWDEPAGLLRGHSTGHYLSALSLAYASTGDEKLKEDLDYMIHQLRTLQEMSEGDAAAFQTAGTSQSVWSTDPSEWGEGFISAYSPDQFALLEVYTPYSTIWAPYYTLHKLLAGFLDAYTYGGNEEALEIAKDLGKWVYNRLSACTQAQLTKMWDMYIAGEFGGMNESLAYLYLITGDNDYLEAAKLFDNTNFFDKLAANYDDIAGRHANQHIPQIIGALKVYEATVASGKEDTYYYEVAKNFWDMVISRYAYSIGGVGQGESFTSPYQQANNISGATNCETCAAYNMLKLTKELYKYDPENAEYMDYYERTLYNQILASQSTTVTSSKHNGVTYMLPIGPGVSRDYSDDYYSFTCCHGTGMENHVKYQEAAYYYDADTMYVNLYMPTTVTWEDMGVTVTQETAFPSETTKLTVSAIQGATAQAFEMKLRVPYWATNGFKVVVNGETVMTKAEASSYVSINVKAGDVIEINMPYTYHLETTPDTLNGSTIASMMYGPWVMVAQDDDTNWKTLVLSTDLTQSVSTVEDADVPTIEVNGLTLTPLYSVGASEAYHTYFKIIQSDDDVDYYQITLSNLTESRGTFTLSAEIVKEGESLTITAQPNDGYMVKSLTANGVALEAVSENTYVIDEVYEDITLVGRFRMIDSSDIDPTRLEQAAEVSAHYTPDWETVEGVKNENWEPTSSNFGTGKGWGDWPQDAGTWAWIMYTWDDPVSLNTNQIYWYDDAGGTRLPAEIYFDYMDEDGEWHDAVITSDNYLNTDQYNEIKLETITCVCLRLNMLVADNAAAVGIGRWKVSYVSTGDVDTYALQTAVNTAISESNKDLYTAESWAVYEAALANAKAVLANVSATQDEVDAAKQALIDAQAALVKGSSGTPTDPVTPTDTPIPTNTPSPTNTPTKHVSHVGKTFVVGNLKYKVTKDTDSVKEVRVTSLKKKVSTLTIPAKVTNSSWGETFKVTSIKAKAFKGSAFTKVTIGKNVTKIGPNAFLNCKKLKTVVIGASVKTIGIRAFYGCSKLTKVTIKSKVISSIKKNAFKKISKKAVIKVPSSKKKAYTKKLKGKIAKGVTIK